MVIMGTQQQEETANNGSGIISTSQVLQQPLYPCFQPGAAENKGLRHRNTSKNRNQRGSVTENSINQLRLIFQPHEFTEQNVQPAVGNYAQIALPHDEVRSEPQLNPQAGTRTKSKRSIDETHPSQ